MAAMDVALSAKIRLQRIIGIWDTVIEPHAVNYHAVFSVIFGQKEGY